MFLITWILWILFIIISITVLLICVVLFIPFNYELKVSKEKKFKAKFRATWFFRAAKVYYNYEKNVLIFTVFGRKLFKKKAAPLPSNNLDKPNETANEPQNKAPAKKEVVYSSKQPSEPDVPPDEQEVSKSFKDQIDMFNNYPHKKELLLLTLKLIKKIFNGIRPKEFSLNAEIGLDDPATTGQFIGLCYTIIPFTKLDIFIKGNYEKLCINGELYIKGSLFLYKIIVPVGIYVIQKPVWSIIKNTLFRKDDSNE